MKKDYLIIKYECNKCGQETDFKIDNRFMNCTGCSYMFDIYNWEDNEPKRSEQKKQQFSLLT